MGHSMLLIILAELLALSTVEGNIHGVLVNKIACRGRAAHFNTTAGTITSPLYPGATPIHISCLWILHNPYQDTVILSFSKFDLEEDKKCGKKPQNCCSHQWIMIKTDGSKAGQDESPAISGEVKEQNNTKKRSAASHSDRRHAAENIPDEGRLFDKTHNGHDTSFSVGRKSPSHLWNVVASYVKESNNYTLKTQVKRNSEINESTDAHRALDEAETTGHMCGDSAPYPISTKAARVIIKFFSHTKVASSHLGFTLQYQISNTLTVCELDEFACKDPHLCVPDSWRCNGQPECPDSSDEANCEAGCAGVTNSQHCDGRWHCKEGEDELGCFGCDADEWWCGEGIDCYKATRRCDGIPDCHNGADEMYCSCFNRTQCAPNSEFCYDPKTQRCDGILHCPSGQDEIDCGGHCHHTIACSHGGGCYTSAQRCDGASQCGDGSDEANCTPQLCHPQHGAYLCANRRCIRDAWRCDQFDDCGDASDEEDCLRNSVIVAAAMGGLVCSLLLVIAIGCTCRLYALRVGIGRAQHNGHRVGRRSTPLAPLSRLEQHLLQREPPPSYSVAVNDPSALLFGSSLSRHWRRQRRRPPVPPEGMLPHVPTPLRGPGAHHSTHAYDAGSGHASRRASFTVGSCGARDRCSSEEKENEERAKVGSFLPVSVPGLQDPAPPPDADDVPLLSAISDSSEEDSMEEREDAPLLDLTSALQETDCDDSASVIVSSETDDTEGSTNAAYTPYHAYSDAASDSISIDVECHTPLAVGHTQIQENICDNEPTLLKENMSLTCQENSDTDDDDEPLCLVDGPGTNSSQEDKEDDVSLSGDVMKDTKAAVLALSAVQRHTDGICQVDTELISH